MRETWPFKDIDSRPRRGRFFPFSFAEAARGAAKWSLIQSNGSRVRICLLNAEEEQSTAVLFAEYKPEQALFIYSWPEAVVPSAAKRACAAAFPIFAPFGRIRVPNGKNNFAGSYLLRFLRSGHLRLTECKIHFQQGKWGGGQSFSTAFRRRVTRVEESELPIPSGLQLDWELVSDRAEVAA